LVPIEALGVFAAEVFDVEADTFVFDLGTEAPLFQLEPKLRLLNLKLRFRHARNRVRYLVFTCPADDRFLCAKTAVS
jgi:hypothetical protein